MCMINSQSPMNHGAFPQMGGGRMGGGGMMQMMGMMMQMMQMLMSLMSGGGAGAGQMGGFAPGMNPNFGGGGGGCGCGGGNFGGGAPFNNFLGGGPRVGGGGGRNDHYVPSGVGQSGPLPNIRGGGQGADATRWALGMEGISESRNPGTVRAISRGRDQAWCADFVSQAYANSGGSPFGHQSSVQGILNWGRQNGKFFNAGAAAQNPGGLVAGDIAVWKSGGKSHVGLVTSINQNGTFNTIEGNSGDAVRRRTHSFGRGLTGFVRPRG